MTHALLVVSIWVCLACQGRADTADRLENAFRTWLSQNDISVGTLAIRRDGDFVREIGVGRPASDPVVLASLGKSITAICALRMVERGDFDWDDDLAGLLGRGPADVALGDLMTHQSGLQPDNTQSRMPDWLDAPQHVSTTVLAQVEAREAEEVSGRDQRSFLYNNENYALLALAIEARAGRSYRDVCAELVLEPAGVQVPPPGRMEGFLPWGGWQMSVRDYGAVHRHWFGPQSIAGAQPEDIPAAAMGGGAFYGAGMIYRSFQASLNHWHFGLLCFADGEAYGAFAVSWMGEWSVVASYRACVDWDAMAALDQVLSRAVFRP